MRKTIVRTMATSTIHAFGLTMEGNIPKVETLDPITVMGKANEKEALKAVKEKYGKDKSITIGSIEVQEDTYEISVEDFVKHAKKIEKTEETENADKETAN